MNLKTLIVDDDKLTQLIHKKVLERAAIADNPEVFSDGEKALNFLTSNYCRNTRYLILLDINMPVMDGWQFLEEISERFSASNIHVVMVSSSVYGSDRARASTYKPVLNFMEKPLSADALQRVKEFIKSKKPLPFE